MAHHTERFHLPADLRIAANSLARQRDITLGQLIRDVLSREVSRAANTRPPNRADERLVAPLRARLADDLAFARGWDDLDRRLKAKGFVLRAAGGGLALHDWPHDRRLCKASDLGFSYARLMRRIGAPFPGHAPSLPTRAPVTSTTQTAPPGEAEDAADDFDVIERF